MAVKRLILPRDLSAATHYSGGKGSFDLLQYVQATTHENFDSFLTTSAIVFVLSGVKNIRTDHSEQQIQAGELFMIPRGEYVMSEYVSGVEGFQSLMLFFDDKVARSILDSLAEHIVNLSGECLPSIEGIVRIKPENPNVAALFHTILSYSSHQNSYQYKLLSLKFTELIYLLLDGPHKNRVLRFLLDALDKEKPVLEDILNKYLYTSVTVEELAMMCGRSLTQFKAEFKERFGQTPHAWLVDKRMARAAFLLATTTRSIDQIAEDCGYSGSASFTRLFSKVHKTTPAVYRTNSIRKKTK